VEAPTRSWLRIFVATTLVLIAAVAVGLAVIQTPRGFKLVVLPLTERWSGGTLQAESGRLSLDGRLQVAGLTHQSSDATLALSADHLVVSLDPLSFVLDDDPLVHELELVGARLVSREAAHEPGHAPGLEPTSAPTRLIPLTVERARLRDVTVELIRRDAVELRIGVVDGSLEGLAPGQTAHLEATTEMAVAPDDPARAEQIMMKLELGLRQDATRTSFEWSGNFDATVHEGVQSARVQGVVFSSAMRGSYKDAGNGQGQLRARAFIDARRKETAIGSVVAQLEWIRSAEANRINAALELSSITQDFLNPFLVSLGSARLASARLDGKVGVRTEEGRTTFESQLRAKDWTLALGEQNGHTPPVDFRSEVSGLWWGATRELVVNAADLAIDDGGQPVMRARLEDTLTLSLDEESRQGAAQEGESAALRGTLELKGVSAARIQPWLRVTRSSALDRIERGLVTGHVEIAFAGKGQHIGVQGELRLRDVVVDGSGEGGPLGPFAGSARIDASLGQLRQLEIKEADLKLTPKGSRPPLTVQVKGSYLLQGTELEAGGQLKLVVHSKSAAPWLEALEVTRSAGLGALPLEAEVTVALDSSGRPTTIEGTQETALSLTTGTGAVRKVALHFRDRIDRKAVGEYEFKADIDALHGDINDQLALEGSLSLQDRARVDVRGEIRELDMGIYLDALGLTNEASPAKATVPQPSSSEPLELPFDFAAELGIGQLSWRELELTQGRVAVSASGAKWRLNLSPTHVVDGSLRGTLELNSDEKPRLAWNVQGSALDVAQLAHSLQPGEAPHITGRLELSSKATGSAPSMRKLRDTLAGELHFDVTDGRLRDLALLKFVTEKTGIGGFDNMEFHHFVGQLELANGWARIQQMEVTGLVRSLVFQGQVGLGGELDLRVNPRISPELTGALRKTRATEALFATTDNWLAVPMDITVQGQLGNSRFGVHSWGSDIVGGTLEKGRKLTGEVFKLGKKSYGKVRGKGAPQTPP
jgi:hypothetical protein